MKNMIAFFKCMLCLMLIFCAVAIFIFSFKIDAKSEARVILNFDNFEKSTVIKENTYVSFENKNDLCQFLKTEEAEGVVLYFDKSFTINYFLQKLHYNVTSSSTVEKMKVFYGYTNDYDKFVIHDNKKVNVQIAKREEGWVVGFPMILSGF